MAEAYEEAKNLIDNKQYEYAIFLLSDLIESNYEKSDALYKRAVCYMNMNRYREASEDLANSITLDRSKPSAYVKQATCYLAIGDLNNAIVSLTSLSQIEPDNTFAQCRLEIMHILKEHDKKAKKLFEEKKYDEVIKIMDECLKEAEICVRFKLKKAECLIYQAKHEPALTIVNDVLFVHKDDLEAICIRAMNLLYQEKYNLGMAELREIVNVSPRATELYKMYKQISEKRKNAERAESKNNLNEAKSLYHEILDIDKKNINQNIKVYTKIAEISFKQKIYDDAIEASTLTLELDNKNVKALKIRGNSNIELNEYDLAVEDYSEIIKLESNESNTRVLEQIKSKVDQDYYSILGVSKGTSSPDIKKAYRELAKIYHPDKNSDKSKYIQHKCKVKFTKISTAYNELQKSLGF